MNQVSVLPFIFKKTSQYVWHSAVETNQDDWVNVSNYKMRENPALCSTVIINPKPSNKYDMCTFMHQLPCKKPCDEVEYQHKYREKERHFTNYISAKKQFLQRNN